MKKAALFATILALALCASAQQDVTFAALPTALSPTALPDGYSSLGWSGFNYVAPNWSGGGDGFKQGPSALNVAFVGGHVCELTAALCSGSISAAAPANALGFHAQSAIVAAGYHAETVNVSAYNRGHFVGSHAFTLATALQEIDFPDSWGAITQLVMETTQGTVVLYDLKIRPVGATAIGQQQSVGPSALNSVGPSASLHGVGPLSDVAGNGGPSGPPVQNVGPAVSLPILDPPGGIGADGSVSPPIIVYPGANAE